MQWRNKELGNGVMIDDGSTAESKALKELGGQTGNYVNFLPPIHLLQAIENTNVERLHCHHAAGTIA